MLAEIKILCFKHEKNLNFFFQFDDKKASTELMHLNLNDK